MVHLLAAFAEHERDQISARTRAALAAAQARGTRLGNPRLEQARPVALAAVTAQADQRAANVMPIIRQLQASGLSSLRAIAEALNARGIRKVRGERWHAFSVSNVIHRGA